MSDKNKAILEEANVAIAEGSNEGFLSFCADDMEWTFVGDKTLKGKEAVRQWMAMTYVEPPKFRVANLIAEGDFVRVIQEINDPKCWDTGEIISVPSVLCFQNLLSNSPTALNPFTSTHLRN